MRKNRKLWIFFLILILSCTVFTACHGRDEPSAMEPSSEANNAENEQNAQTKTVYGASSGEGASSGGGAETSEASGIIAETTPCPTPSDDVKYSYISKTALEEAASAYNISTKSNAYKCLMSLNNKYGEKLTAAQKKGVAVFLFEGVGSSSSASKRMNAMCVVVKNCKIIYLCKNCTTIPDYPFNPAKNDGTPMPTLMSGIYSFTTTNHHGTYAALNVSSARAVRFRSKTDYYVSRPTGINVHRRSTDSIAAASAAWVNSAGCQLVGAAGTGASAEYARFIKAVGIVGSGATGTSKYSTAVSGKIVIDRTYAEGYLKNVGYSAGAITMLNQNQVK